MPLTDVAIRNAKPGAKPYKLSDSGGLFVLVTPAGGKLWRYKYRFAGKEKSLSLGAYPELTLAPARVLHFEARQQLNQGIDPGVVKQSAKAKLLQSVENSFSAIYQEWQESRVGVIQQAQIDKSRSRIEKNVLPWLGNKPVSERAGLAKLDSPISDKKSLVFLAQSAQESNDETTQKESHGRFQGQGSVSSAARG